MSNKQVFHDLKKRRWKYFSLIFWPLSFIAIISLIISITSFTIKVDFPNVPLKMVLNNFRNSGPVTNNKKIIVPQTPNTAPTSTPIIMSNDAVNNPVTTAPVSGKKPKVISFYVNWDDNSFSSLQNHINSMDEIVPEWLHLSDGNGEIVVDDQDKQDIATNFIRSKKPSLLIDPLVNNINPKTQDWDSATLENMLKNPQSRARNIKAILSFIQTNHLNGISIDYENIPDTSQNDLITFMSELYATLHPLGLQVTQNVPLDDDSYDIVALSKSSDFLILMSYDEHSLDDTQAGAIASQKWFTSQIQKKVAQIGSKKIIIALGGYGYDWYDGGTNGDELTFQDAIDIARQAGSNIHLNSSSLNPTFDYYDAKDKLRHVWFLDATTLFNEVKSSYNDSAGYALWRLGSEDPSIWQVFTPNSFNLTDSAIKNLQSVQYGYDIDYNGTGEILKVVQTPENGTRSLVVDSNGLISDETFSKYPMAYTVDRWGGNDDKKVALTFDDGPDAKYTPEILNILKSKNVKATFFVIGANASGNQDIIKRAYSEGHEIGNHTFTHPNIATISDNTLMLELNSTERLLETIIKHKTLLFRPPYAEDIEPSTPDQIKPLLLTNQLGYYTVSMHVDPNDWALPGVKNIVNDTVSGIESGDGKVVLLHDSGGNRDQTIKALPEIIDQLQKDGYQFTTISGLLGLSRDAIMPPISSYEPIFVAANNISFSTLKDFNSFLTIVFNFGIGLSVGRMLLVLILAIIQLIITRRRKYQRNYEGSVSVLIPAYNEEKVIVNTVNSVLASSYPIKEIIIINDGSTDKTLDVLQKEFSNNKNIIVITKSNGGKADALNFALDKVQSEIIITLDADTVFTDDTIRYLVKHFSDPQVGAAAGNAKVGNRVNAITKWQALEYITSQNLDRRAFEVLNCISVVPGSVGAWRKQVVLEVGGFRDITLAEDADLTFSLLENGYKVIYEDKAVAYTEAPDSVRGFLNQRFRWMFGTIQTAWLHRNVFLRPKYKTLGIFMLPNIIIFQLFFPLISPLIDLTIVLSIIWTYYQRYHHPEDASVYNLSHLLIFYLLFLAIDLVISIFSFVVEKKEDWKLLPYIVIQRFFYRQLLYIVAVRVSLSILQGKIVSWVKIERKDTVYIK